MRLSSVSTLMTRARGAAADLLFPPRCLSCDGEVDVDGATPLICDACRKLLRFANGPTCPKCAARLPEAAGSIMSCSHCADSRLKFDRAVALGPYEGRLRELILQMKTDGNDLLARMLGEIVWQERGDQLAALGVDVVAPIPMHLVRRWQRGANPQRAVAELFAGRLGVPAAPGMLRLRRKVPVQLGLSRVGRFRNVRQMMRVAKGYSLKAAHVLVVDDILTTGATCSEAARALKLAGAGAVSAIALARTEVEY